MATSRSEPPSMNSLMNQKMPSDGEMKDTPVDSTMARLRAAAPTCSQAVQSSVTHRVEGRARCANAMAHLAIKSFAAQ